MVRRCVHRRADDMPLAICDGGPEVVLAIRIVTAGHASGDNSDDICAERIQSQQGLGGSEELSRTHVKINAHPSDFLAHSESILKSSGPVDVQQLVAFTGLGPRLRHLIFG
jgi:hypothetical protein